MVEAHAGDLRAAIERSAKGRMGLVESTPHADGLGALAGEQEGDTRRLRACPSPENTRRLPRLRHRGQPLPGPVQCAGHDGSALHEVSAADVCRVGGVGERRLRLAAQMFDEA